MSDSLELKFEFPPQTCSRCGVTSNEGQVQVASGGKVVWRGCHTCWTKMQEELPARVELQEENRLLLGKLTALYRTLSLAQSMIRDGHAQMTFDEAFGKGGEPHG